MYKKKYTVLHYWNVDDVEGFISETLLGEYTTYATSEAKAISNIRYRLGISLVPYDIGQDKAGWNSLEIKK